MIRDNSKLVILKNSDSLPARHAAKQALLALTGSTNPEEFSITNGVLGQPIVHHPRLSNLRVSISHSKNYSAALAFFEECPMAIDLEEIDEAREKSVMSQMTRHEITNVINHHSALVLWTAKESLSKILMTGLHIDFALLEIKQIHHKNNVLEGYFTNFNQYKFWTHVGEEFIYTITAPILMSHAEPVEA